LSGFNETWISSRDFQK